MAKDTGKESLYFSHDYNARSDPKIRRMLQKLGWEAYGLFWAIVEDLYINGNRLPTDYEGMAYDLRANQETIKRIIEDFELFKIEENFFESVSIKRRMAKRDEKSEQAKLSVQKRWEKYYSNVKNKNTNVDLLPTNVPETAYDDSTNVPKTSTIYIDSIDSIDREIDKEKSKVVDLTGNKIFNIEEDLLKNQIQFEKIGMATSKKPDQIKASLHKFHLHLTKKEEYPIARKAAYAGFEMWILNERNFNNSPPEAEKQKTGIPKNIKTIN
jgi:hypothetical protein